MLKTLLRSIFSSSLLLLLSSLAIAAPTKETTTSHHQWNIQIAPVSIAIGVVGGELDYFINSHTVASLEGSYLSWDFGDVSVKASSANVD